MGTGTILTSAYSRQKSFKVLSKRRIETSKGRKTKAHPSPAPHPHTAALIPAWDLGPCPGLKWDPRPHAGGAQCGGVRDSEPVSHKPQTKPRNPSMGRGGRGVGVGGQESHGGREHQEREKSEKSTILDFVMLHIYISVYIYIYRYRYLYIDRFSFFCVFGGGGDFLSLSGFCFLFLVLRRVPPRSCRRGSRPRPLPRPPRSPGAGRRWPRPPPPPRP